MRKVCEVYLVSSASSDERGVELTFPVSQYEMMDAFEQIHTKSPGDVYWQVDEFHCFDYLAPHLDESMSIFEFNSLTEQLSKLDERDGGRADVPDVGGGPRGAACLAQGAHCAGGAGMSLVIRVTDFAARAS